MGRIFLGGFLGGFLIFGRIFLQNFSDGIFWEKFFGRIFWEDIFGRIFMEGFFCGGFFGRYSRKSYLNMEGIDLFVKILVFVKILYIRKGRKKKI